MMMGEMMGEASKRMMPESIWMQSRQHRHQQAVATAMPYSACVSVCRVSACLPACGEVKKPSRARPQGGRESGR